MTSKYINSKWLTAFAIVLILIIVLTHIPQSIISYHINITHFDKLLHVLSYGILGYLLFCSLKLRSKLVSFWVVILVVAVIAGLDELTQPLVQRCASIADWLADCIGVCSSCFLRLFIKRD